MISQRNSISAPQFLNELQNTTILENEQCEFHITAIGSPTPQINWFKDGFEIFSSRRTKIINDSGSSTLIFHQTALTDEGEIKCTATNRYGHVVSKFLLKIDAPPKIRLPRQYEDGFLVEAGETIKLKVGLAGKPIPVVYWLHDNEIIRSGGRYEIITNEKNSFLKIGKVTRKDRGEYNVRAINKLGEFNSSFLVTVTAKPSQPQNVRIAMSLGTSVTLAWNEPDDDGGCKIGNYIVEYFRIGWDVWLKASSTRGLTATLNDLIEGSEYKFRVKAESPYGLSEPSDESRILFIPDHKRGITSPVDRKSQDTRISSTLSPQSLRKINIDKTKTSFNQIIVSDVPKNVELISQIYDNEQIVRELSYGTSVNNNTNSTKKKEEILNNNKQRLKNPDKRMKKRDENQNITDEKKTRSTAAKFIAQKNSDNDDNEKNMNRLNKMKTAHDEVHTSNEYMLVLYEDEKSANEAKESK